MKLFGPLAGVMLLAATLTPPQVFPQTKSQLIAARKKMVQESVIGAGVTDRRVINSMLVTPRHEFVPFQYRSKAYLDMALPIGNQQTISSPFIVAFMTESLDPKPMDKVLEIGTGSGYQAAVLSPLVKEVYTIEIVESLGRRAASTLRRLNYANVSVRLGDGFQGWPEHAPFDKIIVTCSPEKVPRPLVEQLREGGLIVIPVGRRYQQTLFLLRKEAGKMKSEALRPTLFVPMTGTAEERRELMPDPLKPAARNGGFELPLDENGFVSDWYYQRQLNWETKDDAPEGMHYVSFSNTDPGRDAHLLQGFAVDGSKLAKLELSAHVKHENVQPGLDAGELPLVAVTFYDESRRDLGTNWIGPFRGTSTWQWKSKMIRIPIRAREGILRIGLFGATGRVSFDDVKIQASAR